VTMFCERHDESEQKSASTRELGVKTNREETESECTYASNDLKEVIRISLGKSPGRVHFMNE
jgi:hypothetical protein